MSTLEIWLLAVSLAIDCFTVSVTSGIILRRIQWRTFLKMAFFFGFFQALMPLIGWFGASRFNHLIESYDHWIAFALLAFLGIRMIREHFKDSEECSFDPTSLKVILTMAVATSIDALAVGISFAFTGFNSIGQLFSPLIIIGIASIITIVSTIKGTNEQIKESLVGAGNNAVVVQLYQDNYPYEVQYNCVWNFSEVWY